MAQWNNSLFGCFKDVKMCLVTWVAPCYVAGRNAQAVGEDAAWHTASYTVPLAHFLCGASIRSKIRESKGIPGSYPMDVLMHFCLPVCALQQEAMETNSFTWDDALHSKKEAPPNQYQDMQRA